MSQQEAAPQDHDDNDAELVSEFPPPPYYYSQASTLTPPPIPHDALVRSTNKAVAQRKAKILEEKARFGGDGGLNGSVVDAGMLGGVVPDLQSDDGPTVAVFGEESYVEVGHYDYIRLIDVM